ncbi:unnamed protein product [Phaeothamnion confervicola]
MNLFGKKKSAPAAAAATPDTTNTILKLRETLTDLEKREVHVQKKIKTTLLDAKQKMAAKDKKGALFALKRKKIYETEINKINGARMTLESQIIALESHNINLQTFQAMRSGATAMQRARGTLDVDDVDEVMENIQEEMEIADQIGEAIARPADSLFDDDELLEELNMMEEQELEDQLLRAPAAPTRREEPQAKVITPDLPAVPTGPVNVASSVAQVPERTRMTGVPAGGAEDDEMRALRELEASMAV